MAMGIEELLTAPRAPWQNVIRRFGESVTYVSGGRNELSLMCPEWTVEKVAPQARLRASRYGVAALDDFRNWLIREAA
jgi:hypothetical protein